MLTSDGLFAFVRANSVYHYDEDGDMEANLFQEEPAALSAALEACTKLVEIETNAALNREAMELRREELEAHRPGGNLPPGSGPVGLAH